MKNNNEEKIYIRLKEMCEEQILANREMRGFTTQEISENTGIQRANVSSKLNKLYKEGRIIKLKGKPVLYLVDLNSKLDKQMTTLSTSHFDMLTGSEDSLKGPIQQAKAAILYPPRGLHSLILGQTGVGKTMFAELMYKFSIENNVLDANSPFIIFNCADYANNPNLLLAHLFGSKKGAYTGATEEKTGLVEKADGGILFLDEIHRLPSEGQEMLFYLIDHGKFSPLGSSDEKKKAEVLLICATTEDKDSALLGTFQRRIPMVVSIPSLRDRTFEERYRLIHDLFRLESKRIGREIIVTSNVIKNLMLYNCPGNIGQLKSDIQLGCANGFLRCISKGGKKISLLTSDFTKNIKEGILHYKHNQELINKIIPTDSKLSFTSKEAREIIETSEYNLPDNFYSLIENRITELQTRGIDEQDINLIMSFDIDNYFKKYISRFDKEINTRELSKIVDNSVIVLVEKYLTFATNKLNCMFSQKVFYGLCLHMSASIERIRQNKKIVNHKLNEIIEKYPEEYAVAHHFSGMIEGDLNLKIPVEEVGFMAMFLSVDKMEEERQGVKPVVVVAMHGNTAATSICDVVNRIVGTDNVFPYDMSLDISTKQAYEELKEVIKRNHRGGGVLLLVDMGSLEMLGELVSEELGVKIRVVDMVTTVMVMECSRKSLTESNIDVIWEDIKDNTRSYLSNGSSAFKEYNTKKDNIIITVCITGEGSAVKLKQMIENNIDLDSKNTHVTPLSVMNQGDINIIIKKISKEKNILAIVGTINPGIHGIPYIPVTDLFIEGNYNKLEKIVSDVNSKQLDVENKSVDGFYDQFFRAIDNEINGIDVMKFSVYFMTFISNIEKDLKTKFDMNVMAGMIFHMSSAVEKSVIGVELPICKNKEIIMEKYESSFESLKKHVKQIEDEYEIIIKDDEICFILSIIHSI